MNAPTALKNLLPTSGVQQGTDIVHESAHLHVTGSATYMTTSLSTLALCTPHSSCRLWRMAS